MIDAFVEGVRSIVQVCHLVILAPVAFTIVTARGSWQAVAGAVFGVVLGGWLFVTNRFGNITDTQLRITAIVLITAIVPLGFPALFQRDRPTWLRGVGQKIQSPAATFAIAAMVATMVTQWWRPCVGVELGSILTNAPRNPWGQFLPSAGFMLGITTPFILIGLAYAAAKPGVELSTKLAWVGSALTLVLAASVIAGQHGEIVSRLFQWSQ
jgi:cytochrome c biogenesis protein CcdA